MALHACTMVLSLPHVLAPSLSPFVTHDTHPEGMLLVFPDFVLSDAVNPSILLSTKGALQHAEGALGLSPGHLRWHCITGVNSAPIDSSTKILKKRIRPT